MSLINDSILLLISVLHILVILFVLMAPFTSNNTLLFLHLIIIPLIVFHWRINDNTCILTKMEKHINKISHDIKPSKKDSFLYQFISPIYDFKGNYENYTTFLYSSMFILWTISFYNFNLNIISGKVNSFDDLVLR